LFGHTDKHGTFHPHKQAIANEKLKLEHLKKSQELQQNPAKRLEMSKDIMEQKKLLDNMQKQKFDTVGDFDGKEEFMLVTNSQDLTELRQFISDKDKGSFDGFLVKANNGEIEEVYGFNGLPNLSSPVQKLETTSEYLKRTMPERLHEPRPSRPEEKKK